MTDLNAAPSAAAAMVLVCDEAIAELETRLDRIRALRAAAMAVAELPVVAVDYRPPGTVGTDILKSAMGIVDAKEKPNGKGATP